MRPVEEFNEVQRLIAAGVNDCAISRHTGIPRTTIRQWRRRPGVQPRHRAGSSECGVEHDLEALPPAAYCYLLGLYLGDGCISRHPRTFHLRITCDTKYPAIIARCRKAIDTLFPRQQAGLVLRRDSKCADVSHFSKHWPCLFPQHGPGRKHHRRIVLEPWQRALVDQATEEFVCGLIHSDGCRVVANDRGVRSVRYHFSNRSDDIHGLLTAALDRLGIHWRRSDWKTVSVYRKADTARLDGFIGPKDRAVPWTDVHYTA